MERVERSSLDEDQTFVELLLVRPDLVAEDFVVLGEARGTQAEGSSGRLMIGWRRTEGPVLLGATTGSSSEALLIETMGLAEKTIGWTLDEWDAAVRGYWSSAPAEIRERVETRWGLGPGRPWGVASWTRAVWGMEPAEGQTAVGIVGTRIPEAVGEAIRWLARRHPVAAFRIRWYGEQAALAPRIERVAGSWQRPGWRPEASERELVRKETSQEIVQTLLDREAAGRWLGGERGPETAGVEGDRGITSDRGTADREIADREIADRETAVAEGPAALLAAIEQRCLEVGSRVTRRGEWIRYEGGERSLRVFPGPAWIDLQFVGIDEGTRIGLGYRYGVPLSAEPPPGAPPGVHLRVVGPDLSPAVGTLVVAWLAGVGREPAPEPAAVEPGPAPEVGAPDAVPEPGSRARKPRARKPRNPPRRRDRR